VLKVSIADPPVLVTVTGLVLPNEHVGAGVTAGAMLHESVTLPVYPLVEVTVIAEVDEPPGLTEDGLALAAASE
jgi:predicted deacylase